MVRLSIGSATGSLISTYRVVSTTFRAESEKMIAQTVGDFVLSPAVVSANEFQLSNLVAVGFGPW